jgi:hypothetical protein
MNSQEHIAQVCESVKKVLLEKNLRYGDSALNPMEVFTKHLGIDKAENLILTRLDDKLSRIKNSNELRKNDVFDLIGYLTLLSVKKNWDFTDLID